MQPLTAAPRDGFTVAQVTDLLTGPAVSVDFGAERLAGDLSVVADISADLAGGEVARSCYATIHGTCDLQLSAELAWGVDLVRPYMTLSDGTVEARWNLGVYCLTTPDRNVGESPMTWVVQGYDRLMLLSRQVGADYAVASGTTYRQALLDVFASAGLTGVLIDGAAADDTLPAAKSWPLVAADQADPDQTDTPVTWLRIVNDLLRAINFRAVWCDANGLFRCEAYQEPAVRAPEFSFDTAGHSTIVAEDRTESQDVWSTPNRWVFRWSNGGTGVEGDGIYTVLLSDLYPDHPLTAANRGLTWSSVVDYEAASQAKLVALGDRRVAGDLRVARRVSARTGPFPGAGHFDVYRLVDAEMGTRKVQASSWRMPLDGGDVEWDWEVIE